MTQAAPVTELIQERLTPFPRDHFLAAGDLNPPAALALLDLADAFVDFNRQSAKGVDLMRGQTVVNLFFENSTRTSSSFEIAAKRLGADVVTMPVASSSVKKGETLIDTAVTAPAAAAPPRAGAPVDGDVDHGDLHSHGLVVRVGCVYE